MHDVNCDNISIASTTRLGKRQDNLELNPRALKMMVASEEQKDQILRLAKNSRGRKEYEKIFIHQDLTPKQRKKRQQLVCELKQKRAVGEEDLIIVNDRIVKRRLRTEQLTER